MAKRTQEFLDPAKPIFIRKPLKAAGRNFLIGQHFDWKKLAVDIRRIRMLFEQRYLTHEEPEVDPKDKVSKAQIEAHQEDKFDDLPKGEWQIQKTGIGWYNLFNSKGEQFQEKGMREAAARELIIDLNK